MMTVVPSPFQLSVLNDSKMQTCHIKLLNVAIEQEQKGKNAVKSNFTSFIKEMKTSVKMVSLHGRSVITTIRDGLHSSVNK